MAVIEAFMDESGTHKGSPLVSVGAVLGARWQWRKFLSMWDARYFHAKDPKCRALKLALFEAIRECELESFVASMKPQDYQKNATNHFKTGLGNPYSVCAFAAAIGACKYCKDNKLGEIAFMIEAGQPNIEFVRATLEYMQTKDRYRIGSVDIVPKKEFIQLCTADFLTHSSTSDEGWYQALLETEHVWTDRITPEKITRMSKQLSAGVSRMRYERHRRLKDTTVGNNGTNAEGQSAQ